jgi:hypothetical protein
VYHNARPCATGEAVGIARFPLSAVLDEESTRRYIAMICHTDHADAERA